MFWDDEDLVEEEWSLSAKLFAGLVFNPFSLANTCNDPLISWFLARITGDPSLHATRWSAKPEYAGTLGRNDWRLHVGEWQIAVECKFGDGIDIHKDCLKYLEGLCRTNRRVVVVASVSELSELTRSCLEPTKHVANLKERLTENVVKFMAWHEITEAAVERLPPGAAQTLRDWADEVDRDGLRLVPTERVTGDQIASLILDGEVAGLPISHVSDARGDRRSTATLNEVCEKRNAPGWAKEYLVAAQLECLERDLVFEPKRNGWVNVRNNKRSYSVTLFPWQAGVTILISHATDVQRFPNYSELSELELDTVVPDNSNWFPRNRTIGRTFTNAASREQQEFVGEIISALSLL